MSTASTPTKAGDIHRTISSILLAAALLAAVSPRVPAAAQVAPIRVAVKADATVVKARPGLNRGEARALATSPEKRRISFLKFRVGALDGPIEKATLRLFATRSAPEGVSVHPTSPRWRETTITYRNSPAIEPAVGRSGPVLSGRWTRIDVTDAIAGAGPVSFALTADSHVTHRSSEARARRPQLVIRTGEAVPSEPPSSRVYAYYYLWWSERHWHNKLGAEYPYDSVPWPLPATLGDDGCDATSLYPGNQLFDVPPGMRSQDTPGVIERHVRDAAAAGLAGFLVNWAGTGQPSQTPDSISYSRRLHELIRAVEEVNSEGIDFKLWLNYKASARIRTPDEIINDLSFIEDTYGDEDVWDHTYSDRIMMIWAGSRKYDLDTVAAVSQRFRGTFFFVGDENWRTWGDGRAAFLDGDQYYWSSQNPYTNPNSFRQLQDLATMVRSSGPNPDGSDKLWFAPLAPGYNSELLHDGSCVPRNDGDTMRALFEGNSASDPDGWVLISWNEIAEGTYMMPMQRWGDRYLEVLGDIMRSAP